MKLNIKNPDAYRNYDIKEKIEAGIVLTGTEIKSVKQGNISLKDSYAIIRKGEAWLLNMYIKPYDHGNRFNKEPERDRKLLLHKKEIKNIEFKIKTEKYSLIPIRVYLKNRLLKVQLGLGKGKKIYDKRRDMAKKDAERRMQQALRNNY